MSDKPVIVDRHRAQYDLEVWDQPPSSWKRLTLGLLARVRHPEAIIAIGAIVAVVKSTGTHAQDTALLFAIGCITVVTLLIQWTDAKNHGDNQRHKKEAKSGAASKDVADNR
jgi:ABC-type nickel/cobalt efflux system permease component RcnA